LTVQATDQRWSGERCWDTSALGRRVGRLQRDYPNERARPLTGATIKHVIRDVSGEASFDLEEKRSR
jgi:hypothetical protein